MAEDKPAIDHDESEANGEANTDGAAISDMKNADNGNDAKKEASSSSIDKEKEDDKEEEEIVNKKEDDGVEAVKEETELTDAQKKEYSKWPLLEIKEPHEHDVLYGRGGGTNHHPGNKRYRQMVEDRKLDYVNSKRLDKPLVALNIIKTWRGQSPPGRFLKADQKTGLWLDVGDKKAREKTSQALREKAPEIRRKQEEEAMVKAGNDSVKDKEASNKKNTRFAKGTKDRQRVPMKHAVLERDHSLGRERLNPGEQMELGGFSWNTEHIPSYGSIQVPPLPGGSAPYPPGRITSQGSHGAMLPHFPPSRTGSHSSSMGGGPPPPHFQPSRTGSHNSSMGAPSMPPPDYCHAMFQEERQRSLGSGRYDSWSRIPSSGSVPPPAMPPYGGGSPYQQQRSGSFGMPPLGGPDRYGSFGMPPPGCPDQNGSFGMPPPTMTRDNSLSRNPLRDASIGHPASRAAFEAEQRSNSGYWGDRNMRQPPPHHRMSGYGAPPPPPQYMTGAGPSGDFGRTLSSGPAGDFGRTPSPSAVYDPHRSPLTSSPAPAQTPYQVDPAIAKTWSKQSTQSEDYDMAANLFGSGGDDGGDDGDCLEMKKSWSSESGSGNRQKVKAGTLSKQAPIADMMPRPDLVKRMTSNQNEDFDTKRDFTGEGRSIKRAALNRDNSMASNRLKAEYAPGALKRPILLDKDMRMLSESMEQSSLEVRPKLLSMEERTSTMDKISMELMVKPAPIIANARSSTIEALALEFDIDTVDLKGEVNLDLLTPEEMDFPKPPALRTAGRLSTAEYFDIVNEPLGLEEGRLDLNREASVSAWLQQG